MDIYMIKKVINYRVDVEPIAKKYDENRSGNDQSGNLFEQSMLGKWVHALKILYTTAKTKSVYFVWMRQLVCEGMAKDITQALMHILRDSKWK